MFSQNDTFPKAPAFIFVIDVSYNNVRSGLINLLCAKLKDLLREMREEGPLEGNKLPRVGIITYNSVVHFYNCKVSPGLFLSFIGFICEESFVKSQQCFVFVICFRIRWLLPR